jgi:hypothetical protein
MLILGSKKLHPEFDLAEASRLYAARGFDMDLSGAQITSPHDLFSVETLRDLLTLRGGTAAQTDVFVFGRGEAPRRDCTKVGGLPYWPADRSWPRNDKGAPYRFLAQFNFADSEDLLAELPGQVLLLLVDEGDDWLWEPNRIRFEWLPLGLTPLPTFEPSLIATKAGPFFGAIHRSADYPEPSEEKLDLDEGENYNLPILNGTKIGGLPHLIQRSDRNDVEGEFLCQLGSIQPAPNAPYPWVNDPLSLGLGQSGIGGSGNSIVLEDMGTIYIFRHKGGAIRSFFESY